MPPHRSDSHIAALQPAARYPPKPVTEVLEEAEQQWIFLEEDLLQTPSILDGMSPDEEVQMRSKGVSFIYQVGMMLKLPQLTLTTAAIFLNRFLMRRSLVAKDGYKPLHHYQIAATALFLATKVEENCRKMKELVVACCRVAQKNPNLLVDEQTKDFWRWRDTILYNEDVLLETICFDLTIEAPHKIFFEILNHVRAEHNKKLRNAGWAFINDSSSTQLCLLFTSRTIAAAALYCGARLSEVSFPDEDGKPWWEVQNVRLKDLRRACNYMAKFYENKPSPNGAESIYVGLATPDGDDDSYFSSTRLSSSQAPVSPAASAEMGRSVSEQSQKRQFEKEESHDARHEEEKAIVEHKTAEEEARLRSSDVSGANGRQESVATDGEPDRKRAKLDQNGTNGAGADGTAVNGSAQIGDEEVSEEGEVEE